MSWSIGNAQPGTKEAITAEVMGAKSYLAEGSEEGKIFAKARDTLLSLLDLVHEDTDTAGYTVIAYASGHGKHLSNFQVQSVYHRKK